MSTKFGRGTRLSQVALLIAVIALGLGLFADDTSVSFENADVEARGQVPITSNQGGTKLTVASGGEIEIQSGATLDVQSGATTDFSGGVDLNGSSLILDANGNTSITADTDDQIDIEVSGADDFVITANLFESQTGSVIDLNGTKLELDADADTSITADTDDQIDIEIGGTDIFQLLGNVATNVSADILDITASVGIQDGSDAAIGLDLNLTGDNHSSTGMHCAHWVCRHRWLCIRMKGTISTARRISATCCNVR